MPLLASLRTGLAALCRKFIICIRLPDYASLVKDPKKYAESFYLQYTNTDPFSAKQLIEPYSEREFVIQNPPQKPL